MQTFRQQQQPTSEGDWTDEAPGQSSSKIMRDSYWVNSYGGLSRRFWEALGEFLLNIEWREKIRFYLLDSFFMNA